MFPLTMILTTKTVYFYVKWFHTMRRVKIICFLTLKAPKKTYMRLERFFVLGSLWILGLFFMLLEAIDWFDKIPKVFHRCFGSKNISKWFFCLKKQEPYFSSYHSGWILRNNRWHVVYCFFSKNVVRPH